LVHSTTPYRRYFKSRWQRLLDTELVNARLSIGTQTPTMHAMQLDEPSSSRSAVGERLSVWLATGLGLGLATPAPGTIAGGLFGLPLAYGVAHLSPLGTQLAAVVLLCAIAGPICTLAANQLVERDPQPIVLDEIVALPIVFLGVPNANASVIFAGFVLFRLFDIWKPGLCQPAERLPGGWGILADDVAAALMGLVCVQALLWLDRSWALDLFGQAL
jgi:phosphatidylglycerophosphatase A